MPNISIVTAFYDIGRGNWTPENGLPDYLQRTNETYIERFSYMTELDNEIVVFSTPDIIEKLQPLNTKGNIKFVSFDMLTHHANLRNKIYNIQKLDSFQNMINPYQRANPEYWNPDYVLVNFLKTSFVNMAIHHKLVSNDRVAWLDFGYCRTEDKIPESKSWSYDFNPEKMHLFNYKDYDGQDIVNIISNNDVYILGAKIVGGQSAWRAFEQVIVQQLLNLMDQNLVDDDQTLLLMSTIQQPELFELHRIPDHQLGLDPFVIFKDFNDEA